MLEHTPANKFQTLLFVAGLTVVAWLFRALFFDLGFDSFEEWLNVDDAIWYAY